MKFFPKGAWNYAVLQVILFSLAALATKSVVDLACERLLPAYEQSAQEISLAIWLLTMGLMFLAGALGLWGISATAESESRSRIAGIVSAMNNLVDGLLALDYQGCVKGANLAARQLADRPFTIGRKIPVSSIFPALSAGNLRRLLNKFSPVEVEIESAIGGGLRRLRLRSQPAEGLVLVFVSDITEMHTATQQQQQSAKLQLLGRIAGGVAHDFSNILSGISGHAALMQRFREDQRARDDSLGIIINETQRGVRLSRQLLALSRSSDPGVQPHSNLVENISQAEELLRVALSAAWKVATEVNGTFPPVPFSASQIVQIVLNLGLLAADSFKKPGGLMIRLQTPAAVYQAEKNPPAQDLASPGLDFSRYAAVIVISASAAEEDAGAAIPPAPLAAAGTVDTTGMIPSVVRTLIEEAGGRLDALSAGRAQVIYRVCLPYVSRASQPEFKPDQQILKSIPDLGQMKILLACEEHKFKWLGKMLAGLGAAVEKKTDMGAVFLAIDSGSRPDVIIADKNLFGSEADSLLKAVRKICPLSGLIIISRHPENEALYQQPGFIFLEPVSNEAAWLNAVLRSRRP